MDCAVCHTSAPLWANVDGHDFTHCPSCGSIALNSAEIDAIDAGSAIRHYDADYWQDELLSAKERAWGSSLARAAEAIHLCQRPVRKFVDIGSGDGSLLDALSYHLPSFRDGLYGVEMFPPAVHTAHPNYLIGEIGSAPEQFDCGVCVEVIEHLTPRMLDNLLAGLARNSLENSCFLFNTGLADYVVNEDQSYIDPLRRGHIVSYGMNALDQIFARHGFRVSAIGQRSWAFLAEFQPTFPFDIDNRTWHPRPENTQLMHDAISGTLMAITARESLRAYR